MGFAAMWKRMVSDGLMSLATMATVAITLVLLATGPIYADAVSLAAAHATLEQAPASETVIGVSVRVAPEAYRAVDQHVLAAVGDRPGGVESTTRRSLASASFRVPGQPGSGPTDLAVLRSADEITDHVEIVDGGWPVRADRLGVAVDERVATAIGLHIGDRFELVPTGTGGGARPVTVTGTYRITDPADPYWTGLDDLRAGGSVSEQFSTHPFVTDPESLVAATTRRLDADWQIVAAVDDASLDELVMLRRAATGLERRLTIGAGDATLDPTVMSAFEVETGLPRLLAGTERSITVTRASVAGVGLQLAVLAGYALMLAGAVAVEVRRRESALLRQRGARPRDLGTLAVLEAAAIAVPLALVAPHAAAWLLEFADDAGPLSTIGLDLRPQPTAAARLIALVGAAVAVVVLVTPVLRGARRAERSPAASRPPVASTSQRAGVDLALVVVAGIAFWQLATLGDDRAATVRGRFGVDPLLIVAPSLGLFVAAIVALRLVPLAARVAEAVVVRGRGAVGALVAWQIARRPSRPARTGLLVISAVAIGVLAVTSTTTWRESQVARAHHQVGADARVTPDRRTGASIDDLHLTRAYESVPGVQRAVAVTRRSSPGSGRRAEIVAIDAIRAATVIRPHDSHTADSIAAALAELEARRPIIHDIDLPGDPRAIAATVSVVESAPTIDGDPIPPAIDATVDLIVRDGADLLHRVRLGSVAAGAPPARLVAELAAGDAAVDIAPLPPLALVGVEARWLTPPVAGRDLTIDISALTVVDGGGAEVPVGGVDGLGGQEWSARPVALGFTATAPTAAVSATTDGVRLAAGSGFASGPVVVIVGVRPAGGGSPDKVPVAVSQRFLDDSGSEVGDLVRLDAAGVAFEQVEIVAVIPSFPTVDPSGADAIIADLPTVQLAGWSPGATLVAPDEYWLDLAAEGASLATVFESAPFEVVAYQAIDVRVDELTNDPPAVGTLGAMSIGFVAALGFAAIGFAVSGSVSARERTQEFTMLRALGLSARQLRRWLAAELAVVAAAGAAIGLAVGIGLSRFLLPRTSLTQRGDAVFPRVTVVHPWGTIWALVAGISIVTVAVVVGVVIQVTRLDAGRAHLGGGE